MKFLDKFVLLPIERYERLLKNSSQDKKPPTETNVLFSKQDNTPPIIETDSQSNTSSNIENKSEQNNPKLIESTVNSSPISRKNPQKNNHSVIKTDSSTNKSPLSQNNSPKQVSKIPSRPPGIPNKKQKLMFKWEPLF